MCVCVCVCMGVREKEKKKGKERDSRPQSPIEELVKTLVLELHQTPKKSKFRGGLSWWLGVKESACQ